MRAEDVLPDAVNQAEINGIAVRKGTIGAFLNNARVLSDAAASAEARAIAERDIVDALPALRALGLFQIFEIKDGALRAFIDAH
jgi:hypothetical protein